jgi:hypothetical protein
MHKQVIFRQPKTLQAMILTQEHVLELAIGELAQSIGMPEILKNNM